MTGLFAYRYCRLVANDYAACSETGLFQIPDTNKERPRAKDNVLAHKKRGGGIKILWKNKPLKTRGIIAEKVETPLSLTA
jgi:hypothetical protein